MTVPVTSATAPPSTPASSTVTPPLYQQALDQAKLALQAQIDPLNAQIQANDAQTSTQVQNAIANAQALSDMLKGIAPAIQGVYTNAANDQGILGKGFSTQVADALNTNAQGVDQTLAGINAPAGQNIDPSQSGKVADVLYGLGGYIPGSTFAQKGAAYAGAAAMLPAEALLRGNLNAESARQAGQATDATLQNKIAELAGKLPGDVQTNYMNLQKLSLDNAKFNESLKKDQFDQAYKIAQQKLATAKYQTSVGEFNVNTKLKAQSLQLQSQKFAQQQLNQDRNYQLSLSRLGISQKNLQLRIASAAFTQAHGGYTTKQVAGFNQKMDAILAGAGSITHPVNGVMPTAQYQDKNGKWHNVTPGSSIPQGAKVRNSATYSNFIKTALKKGVPIQLALQRANTIFPETERGNLGSLADLPAVAAQAAQQTRDYKQMTGQILGTSPNGVDIHWAAPTNLSAKGKATVSNVLSLAQEYLGTPYAWGGSSPTGFDCSGLAQYIYAKSGISIPRTTYTQFQTGLAVPKNKLEEGDLVFFKGSDSKGGLPGHVGIYIGGGKMIQAPHTGDVVQVSSVSSFPGYMGARRYVH